MKIKLHYTKDSIENFFTIEGANIEEIQEQVKEIESEYNINPEDNNMWSEEIK